MGRCGPVRYLSASTALHTVPFMHCVLLSDCYRIRSTWVAQAVLCPHFQACAITPETYVCSGSKLTHFIHAFIEA
jgi:hypothetical protein